ncbi:MAG: tetraacyldisaccharide 4'-kinase [Bacteroidota bacterium]
MSFNFFLFKGLRLLLFPFSLLVWMYLRIRNWLYNKKFLTSAQFNLPIICIGNLSVGGTGKSPMVEYLLGQLSPQYKLGTISRGYKRKTKGYVLAGEQTTALEIGDEPMQFHLKFPQVAVAVGEQRILAVPQLLHDHPDTRAIILDDAFQHREIVAGLNIILTDYNNPYWYDWYLPTGELRDNKRSAYRAQVIIVTKCPPGMTVSEKNEFLGHIKPVAGQQVFFTMIDYGIPYHIITKEEKPLNENLEILLACGIANPAPLKQYIEQHSAAYFEINFSDHHIFTIDDFKEIENRFNKLDGEDNIILTTEKDAVRLVKFGELLAAKPVYVLPIRARFLFEGEQQFNKIVAAYIESYSNEARLIIQ